MPSPGDLLRIVLERLLALLFAVTRVALLAQGLAMLAAVLAASAVVQADSPPWLGDAMRSSRLVSATLLVAGVLLLACRRVRPASAQVAGRSDWFWAALLALSLVLLAWLARLRAQPLAALWEQIGRSLDEVGFFSALGKSDPYGGIVLLPIMAALLVPLLETVAAWSLTVLPVVMVVLLATRSPLFPRLFTMLVVCQVALVVAGVLAADAFSTLSTEFVAAMAGEADAEVQRVGELIGQGRDVLASTSIAFVAPALGMLAWLPFVLRPALLGAWFSAGADSNAPGSRTGTN